MIVGIPGSGIGGLYYIILGLGMPLCELVQTVRGRSSWARWRVAGVQAGYSVGILGALAGGGWLVHAIFIWTINIMSDSPEAAAARRQAVAHQMEVIGWTWMAWISALTLLTVILLPAMLAWGFSLRDRVAAGKAPRVDYADFGELKAQRDA
jgi:hypothetical protein